MRIGIGKLYSPKRDVVKNHFFWHCFLKGLTRFKTVSPRIDKLCQRHSFGAFIVRGFDAIANRISRDQRIAFAV